MNTSPRTVSWFLRLQRRLFASRFLTFSLLLHVIILIVGGGIIIAQRPTPPDLPPSARIEMSPAVELPPIDPTVTPPAGSSIVPPAPITPPTVLVAITRAGESESFQLPPASTPPVPQSVAVPESPGAGIPRGTGLPQSPTAINRGADRRGRIMIERGGTPATEAAVMKGLHWLKSVQNSDGSWSNNHQPAMTGLALLAFLGHGETQVSAHFGATVRRALEWLRKSGDLNEGRFAPGVVGNTGSNSDAYEHAIATYALADYFVLTGDEGVEPLLRKAVGYIIAGQAPDGGWNYGYSKEPNSDTSVSGWQIQALASVHQSKLIVDGLDAALDRAMTNLQRVQSDNGNFGYRQKGDRGENASLVGVGTLCSALWPGGAADRTSAKGARFLLQAHREKLDYHAPSADLYAWYYNAQACSAIGGTTWLRWNRLFRDEIVAAQSANGSWPATSSYAPGAELQRQADGAGPIYRTALCTLMLETYYRNTGPTR